MDRILTWYIDEPSVSGYASYFLNCDCSPVALRIYASRAPDAGDLTVDVLDDGVSIMASNPVSTTTKKQVYGSIEYRTLAVSTFSVGEQIEGGTSAATARVVSDNKIGTLTFSKVGKNATAFTVGETITGATSGSTAVVDAYVAETFPDTNSTSNEGSRAILVKGENAEPDAEDFSNSETVLEAGSWISIDLTPNGAKQVTIQLELSESDEIDEEVGV